MKRIDRRATSLLVPILCGLFLPWLLILNHECGHYLAASVLNVPARFHAAEVSIDFRKQGFSPMKAGIIAAAGPIADALISALGLTALWAARRARHDSAVSVSEWVFTVLALDGCRWLRCLSGTPSQPQPNDEAVVSRLLGWYPWVLPYALLPVSLMLLIAIARLHPKGSKLASLACAMLSIVVGIVLWFTVIGPRLFS